jgi:hypothetical protein
MARKQLGTPPDEPNEAATKGSVETALGGVPTTVGKALVTAADGNAARTAIGATATGKSLITAADAAAARTAIGAAPLSSELVPLVHIPDVSSAAGRAAGILVSRMTVEPPASRRVVIEGLISDLMSAGVWDSLDGLYVFAAHDRQAARLNWTALESNPVPSRVDFETWKPSAMRDATEVNAPIFTVDRGFAGDGRGAYVSTNTTGDDLNRFTTTNCSAGVYSRTSLNNFFAFDLSGMPGLLINPDSSGLVNVAAMADPITAAHGGDNTGLFGFSRSGTSVSVYKDGVALGSGTATNNRGLGEVIEFLRRGESFSSRQISAGFVGSSLTAAQWVDLDAALKVYLTTIGAAV